ncbi:MAG: RecX family transcriptional regulator [Bacteroidales bacterium]|nr:RecX family transcriptional regulator [Candidatus Scybalocola fimicaballi]
MTGETRIKTWSKDEALAKMSMLCAESEKCKTDIADKLKRHGLSTDDIESILTYLESERFIDEARYSKFFAKDKYRFAKWGRKKIEYALKMKRIPVDFINEALEEIPDDAYEETMMNVLTSKLKTIKFQNRYDAKGKLFRFAASRGYESGVALEAIDKILNETLEEDDNE